MADDVRAALALLESLAARVIRTTRLIVLPFRLLRPDPEIDFLALSLADAITASLAEVEFLVLFRRVEAAHREAAAAFATAGGERLLGVQERR